MQFSVQIHYIYPMTPSQNPNGILGWILTGMADIIAHAERQVRAHLVDFSVDLLTALISYQV
jgi:hypothetical protein